MVISACTAGTPSSGRADAPRRWGLVIHTGAGNFTIESLGDRQAPMRAAMQAALMAGHTILAAGGELRHLSDRHRRVLHPFTVAKDICARVQYLGTAAQTAADEVIHQVLEPVGGSGGVVGLDRQGHVIMSFNTTGMGRGYVGEDGRAAIKLTREQ